MNGEAVKLWLMTSSPEGNRYISELMDRIPPGWEVLPGQASSAAALRFYRDNRPDERTGLKKPTPPEYWGRGNKLVIRDPSFSLDFFEGGPFCSARLRKIFDLPPEVVQYLPVDDSACPSSVQSQDYRIMNVLAYRRAIDLQRSTLLRMKVNELGEPGPERIVAVTSVVFEDDFESDVPVFLDPHDPRIFVTDAFADRVLKSGITDISFLDVASDKTKSGELVVKTV